MWKSKFHMSKESHKRLGWTCQNESRWTKSIIQWRPWLHKRSGGRPSKRWLDDVKKSIGRAWHQIAQYKEAWKLAGEAYNQKWTARGSWKKKRNRCNQLNLFYFLISKYTIFFGAPYTFGQGCILLDISDILPKYSW